METLEAILSRRSVRAFSDKAVPAALLNSILRAATAGPSGGNGQPWSFVVVKNAMRRRAVQSMAPGMGSVPPVIIALCLDTARITDSMPRVLAHLDVGVAMQNALLAAHDLDLGAYVVGSFQRDAVAAALQIPNTQELIVLIALGYPATVPSPPSKRPFEEMVWAEKFGDAYGT